MSTAAGASGSSGGIRLHTARTLPTAGETGPFQNIAYDQDIFWADGFFIRFSLGNRVQ